MYRMVSRSRSANLPSSVLDAAQINESFAKPEPLAMYGTTQSGHRFFRTAYSCPDFSYCVFASPNVIRWIELRIPANNRRYLMDATFKICPFGVFNQLLIIHVSYAEVCFVTDFSLYLINFDFIQT